MAATHAKVPTGLLTRLMSAPVFRLKGGGWYETDFKGDGDNKKNLADALHKLEQRLAHIRENLDSKQLADEFERAHELRKTPPPKHAGKERNKK